MLKLSPSLRSDDAGHIHCEFELTIDGELLEHYDTDPFDLLSLFKNPEWVTDPLDQFVYLWTCSCGEPGCAGIAECKIIKRDGDIISVGIPRPISHYAFSSGTSSENYDSGYKRWKVEHKVKLITLSLAQVRAELLRFAQEIRELTKNVELQSYSGGYIKHDEDDPLFDLPTKLEEALQKV